VLGDDGTYWISDEYAAYVYQFDKKGKMIKALSYPSATEPKASAQPRHQSTTQTSKLSLKTPALAVETTKV
jgi:hypothetical protein